MESREVKDWLSCVEPGWASLVEPLLKELFESGGTVAQIKEKFGGLRFYYNASPSWSAEQADIFEDQVVKAEAKSYTVCEVCGVDVAGVRTRGNIAQGWLKTVCENHYQEWMAPHD